MKVFKYTPSLKLKYLSGINTEVEKTHLEFLLEQMTDPIFIEGLDGFNAVEFAIAAKKELTEQEELAKKTGWWVVEDSRAKAHQRAVLRPTRPYNIGIAESLYEFMLPLKELESYDQKTHRPKEEENV